MELKRNEGLNCFGSAIKLKSQQFFVEPNVSLIA